MKIVVFGAGLMGRAAAWDMMRSDGVEKVLLLDADKKQLEEAAAFAGDVEAVLCDASDGEKISSLIAGYDALLSCVPYHFNLGLAKACIKAKVGMVDLGGNNDVVDAQFALHDEAKEAGVTLIPDCGLAPGMGSIWAMAGVEELDECHTVEIRCGGLPVEPKPPLNYMRLFSINGLINEYIEPCRIVEDGEEKIVDGMGGHEKISFPAPFEEMEAFYTSGGTSTLVKTLLPRIENLDYKTIRYPGHIQHIQVIHDLGLTSSEPINVAGTEIAPRAMLEEVMQRNLPDEGADVTLLRVDCIGDLDDEEVMIRRELIDYADAKTGLSSMMRCTALPAAAITRMIASGTISLAGTQTQELVVPPEVLTKELKDRNVILNRYLYKN
jgi:lysine 6-dehydrogenase